MADKYYYISYSAQEHTASFGVEATCNQTPAEWSIEASTEFDDGPYIVLYAEEITKEQYEHVIGHMV